MFGYERKTTPNFDRIAKAGSGFNNCFSHGIWSFPSAGSMLTGTYPLHHGLGGRNEKLPKGLKTVSEIFSESGYQTVGISANPWVSENTGLNRGFDDFEQISISNIISLGPELLLKYLLSLNSHSGGYTQDTSKFVTEYLTMGLLRRRVHSLSQSEDPFFIYAHTEGAHTPYYPPKSELNEFDDELLVEGTQAREMVHDIHVNLYREIAHGLDLTKEEWNALNIIYDTLIRYVDSQLGRTYDSILEETERDTVIVVTSDHGDLLGEEGLLSHKVSLNDALINVPLAIHNGPSLSTEQDGLIQHIDVMKTIMEYCGVETNHVQGINLQNNYRENIVSYRSADYYQKTMNQVLDINPNFDVSNHHSGDTICVRNRNYKLIQSPDKKELFKTSDENMNIISNEEEIAEELSSALETHKESVGTGQTHNGKAEFGGKMQQRLEDLGYI